MKTAIVLLLSLIAFPHVILSQRYQNTKYEYALTTFGSSMIINPEKSGFVTQPGFGYGIGISTKIFRHNYPEIRFSHSKNKISNNLGQQNEYSLNGIDFLPLNYKLKTILVNIRCKEKIIGYLNVGGGFKLNFAPALSKNDFGKLTGKSGFDFNTALGFYRYNNQAKKEIHFEVFYYSMLNSPIEIKHEGTVFPFKESMIGIKIMLLLHMQFKYSDM